MFLSQNTHWQTSTLFRGLLTIVFVVWLVNVMAQYDKKTILQQPEITTKQTTHPIILEQLTLPAIPKPESKPKTSVVSKINKSSLVTVTKVSKQTAPANQQQIEYVYQKLSDEGMHIQIAWPQHTGERQKILNFMYQCVGMQFAVLNGNTLTKYNHTKFDQTNVTDYSKWIRIAQGSLSKKEQRWLHAYALKGIPIRLFPSHIDWRLAQYLANALKGDPLSSFRASYQLTNQKLQLTQIQINNQHIVDNWELFQGKC